MDKARWTFIRLSHDGIALSCWSPRFDCNTARLHQAMKSIVCVSLSVACWFVVIGAFRSSLLFRLLDVVPSQVRFVVDRLLCFLIVGIQASGISFHYLKHIFNDKNEHILTLRGASLTTFTVLSSKTSSTQTTISFVCKTSLTGWVAHARVVCAGTLNAKQKKKLKLTHRNWYNYNSKRKHAIERVWVKKAAV